jgi:aspartyl-tRNA(Asn)/glutamyl-tRNA(Gln) amidotransferase subunit B
MEYESVIGLEVHVQLNTKSKIFCGCSTKFGAEPNSQTCPICLGLPGTLPVMNKEALKKGLLAGLALNCEIAEFSKFDRKNYFYPDLPKAYQVSQLDKPVCKNGYIDIPHENETKRIGITRLHLEEDAGKLVHPEDSSMNISLVDANRGGMPLAEIVSEPDMRSGDDAYNYLTKLKSIVKYIDVSDANMEEGSLRCDVNISVREKGESKLGERVEVKNLNSFKAVKAAISYEFERQTSLIKSGEKELIVQETRLWDADRQETYSMRSKEDAVDYRYYPDYDLPPMIITKEYIEELRASLPELPDEKRDRFKNQFNLSDYDADVLTSVKQLADYYEETVLKGANPKKAANWISSELLGRLDAPEKIFEIKVKPADIAELLKLIDNNTISGKIAKTVFKDMLERGGSPQKIIDEKGLVQVSDSSEIEKIIDDVLSKNEQSVADYKNGKEKAMGFLIGQIMKESKGKANPQVVNELLIKKLNG